MQSLGRRVVVVVVMGALGLVGSMIWRRQTGQVRFAAARERITAECRAWRAAPVHAHADVCRHHDEFGPKTLDIHRRASIALDDAETRARAGDVTGAETKLMVVVTAVSDLEKIGTFIANISASKLVKRTLDVLDRHPQLSGAGVLRTVRLGSDPLEASRLDQLWWIAHTERTLPVPSDATLADMMERDETVYREMEKALAVSDLAACEQAAAKSPMMTLQMCATAAEIQRTKARLEARHRE